MTTRALDLDQLVDHLDQALEGLVAARAQVAPLIASDLPGDAFDWALRRDPEYQALRARLNAALLALQEALRPTGQDSLADGASEAVNAVLVAVGGCAWRLAWGALRPRG